MVKKFEAKLYATMNWFEVAEQPDSTKDLPIEFAEAKKLWKSNKNKNKEKIIALLQPYLIGLLVVENLTNWRTIFGGNKKDSAPEIEAKEVNLIDVDFSVEPIPKCQVEAFFEVQLSKDPSNFDFEEWQGENAPLSSAVSFAWMIERNSKTEQLDFTFEEHKGVDCNFISHDDESSKIIDQEKDKNLHIKNLALICIKGLCKKDQKLVLEFLEASWAESVMNLDELRHMKGDSITLSVDKNWLFILPTVIQNLNGLSDTVSVEVGV